jgi:hypothetical protein
VSPLVRRVLAVVLIVVAGMGVLIFGGGQVAMCLGPLNVTAIQCAKVTGIVPATGFGIPLFAVAVAVGVLLLAPVPSGKRRRALHAAAIAAGATAIVFAVWPRTWTGVDSAGAPVSIERPFDVAGLATVVIIAASVAALAWAHLASPNLVRFRRGPTR